MQNRINRTPLSLDQRLPRAVVGLLIAWAWGLPVFADTDSDETRQAWQDSVMYRAPEDSVAKCRVLSAVEWLKQHAIRVKQPGQRRPFRVVAWKDPTLDPENPNVLAGYLITDTLWSAKALRLFDSPMAEEMEWSLQRLGWYGNDLHDVLFHPLDQIWHCPADRDFAHGFSLDTLPTSDGTMVNLRVFRQKWDAKFDQGHPSLFAEHAVYRALYDFWQHREDQARCRVREIIANRRLEDSQDHIVWDSQAAILVDHVTMDDWVAFREGKRAACRQYTFKIGLLVYAIGLLGMEDEFAPLLEGMEERLWSAQTPSGGMAHFVDVRRDGSATPGVHATGEATAVAILAKVVQSQQARFRRSETLQPKR